MVLLTEIRNMFWGVTIDGGKRYSQTVERSFHISMAALEPSSAKDKNAVSIMIQHEKAEFLLCSLENGQLPQQPLDLNFTEGEEVTFFLNGTGIVHLTGFLLEEEGDNEDMRDMTDDSMDESEDEEVPELEPIVTKSMTKKEMKRKLQDAKLKGVKKKKVEIEEDSDDDDDEFDNEDSYFDEEAEEMSDEEGEEGSLSNIFDGEDCDEEEEDSEEEVEQVKKTTPPPNSKQLTKKEKKDKRKSQEGAKQDTAPKKPSLNTSEVSTPVTNNLDESGDASTKKKKKKKKNKGKDGENTPKQEENTPKAKASQTPKKKVVAGGTVVEELKVGSGPEVKPGKMAHMYYSGKLASNGKQFDACISGKPFKFRLGRNEVIKGWENGVNGMKVGGKRRLTVPAQQAYGSQRQGPIPPNSTLVFDIELKAVS